MAIICYICKKEVELIRFGKGFVGICCKKVFYNDTDTSSFDLRQKEKNEILLHSLHLGTGSYQEKHP